MSRFRLAGKDYVFNGELTVQEAMDLFDRCKLGTRQIYAELDRGHPYAIAAWIYMLARRAQEACTYEDVLKRSITGFEFIPDAAVKAGDAPVGSAEDPTGTGMSPDEGISATS